MPHEEAIVISPLNEGKTLINKTIKMNTELNNKSMATVVETFFVEETLSLVHDATDLQKWNDLVEFLELAGQKTIVKGEKSPIPFLWMNSVLINVFETLCPSKVDVNKYNKMPIPLEVLDLIALSTREGYFDLIKIWYDEKTPDPVCVGYRVHDEYKDKVDGWYKEHYSEKYLLGKWSDVKATFKELIERAKLKYINSATLAYKTQIKQATRALEDVQDEADNKFSFTSTSTGGDLLPF